nr:NADH dehydrogenase subunit 3 [Crassostrea talonata]UOU85760.1 NADH dehydrogenase subunit 3 [Crassostrea talonata]
MVEVMFLVVFLSVIPILFSLSLVNLVEDAYDWDKSSPYECGFSGAEAPGDFSSRFFHLVILFLVWDVEIVLLIPCFQDLNTWSVGSGALAIFLLVLALGLYYEIMEGTIKWALQSD